MSRDLLILLIALLVLGGCQLEESEVVEVLPQKNDTEAAILSVIHDLFQGMEARDSTRIGFTLHPEALFVSVDLTQGVARTKRTERRDFISAVGQPGLPYIERIHDAVVQYSGEFAEVWAPYEFYVGDSLSHCGHDAFQLVREDQTWRILGITYSYTVCP